MKLPTGVLAYKVLKIANISNEKQELQTQIAYVKSESVFYLSKATDGRYQDLKITVEMIFVNIQRMW